MTNVRPRDHTRILTPALSKRLDALIEHLRLAPWESVDAWCYRPGESVNDIAAAASLQAPTDPVPAQPPACPKQLGLQVAYWACLSLECSGCRRLTVDRAIDRIERHKAKLIKETTEFAVQLVEQLVSPGYQLPVLERPAFAAHWPWPFHSVPGTLAHLLMALCPTLSPGEWLPSLWPAGADVAAVAAWARPILDGLAVVPPVDQWRLVDVSLGAPLLTATDPQSHRSVQIPTSALAHLYSLEREVIEAKRIPRMRIDAGQVQQGVIAGHSPLHLTLERDSIFPNDGTADRKSVV